MPSATRMSTRKYDSTSLKRYVSNFFANHQCTCVLYRPDAFPPSYEESQCHRDTVDSEDVLVSPAPPLYSQDSSEAPGCTWSWEQPPPYSQTGCIQQQDAL